MTGVRGERGRRGDVGPRGDEGLVGPPGDVGESGAEGAAGPVGEPGVAGLELNGHSPFARLMPLLATLFALVAVAGVVFALLALQQTRSVQGVLERQVQAAQLESLRNCIRNNINAAVVRISVTRPEPGRTAAQDAADNRIADNLYPVLDCLQSQRQRRSVKLSLEQSSRYVRLVTAGRAPIVTGGKVTGSRPSVLDSAAPGDIDTP